MDLNRLNVTGRDVLKDRLATLRVALLRWPKDAGTDEIAAAAAVLERLEEQAPPLPGGSERDTVKALAAQALTAAVAGEPFDMTTEARLAADRFDLDRVTYYAAQGAIEQAKRHLGTVVLANAERAYRAWSAQAADIAQSYAALGPVPDELEARRQGGKALKAWEAATELRETWSGVAESWRSLRMLQKPGDPMAFETSAIIADRGGHSLDEIDREARRASDGSGFLDLCAQMGLVPILDSATSQGEREVRWRADDKARREGRSLAGSTWVNRDFMDEDDAVETGARGLAGVGSGRK